MRFVGRTVVVTGAGSGMGRAMIQRFFSEGASVVATDIDQSRAEETIKSLDDQKRAAAFGADVADPGRAVEIIDAAIERFGQVDVLCNNAGVLDGYAPALETSVEQWNRVLSVNLTGPFCWARAVLPGMVERASGAIVNTASIASFVAGGGGTAYTASKHGVLGLTKQLAFDYGRRGIRVNAVCPGAIHTGMTDHLTRPETRVEHVDQAIGATPAGRWGKPEEIASMAAYLASDEAAFIHGSAFTVDGGWVLP